MKKFLILILFFFASGCGMNDVTHSCIIVCFGDSYTEGLGADSSEAYPARLQEALRGVKVINAGVSGETAEEGLRRIEGDVLSKNPALVIVEFGTNEAFRDYPVEEALRNIEKIVERVRAQGADVILVGTRFGSYQENFDEGLRSMAKRYSTGLVLNVLDGVLDHPALKSDVYHPNREGYRIMAERILPEVRRVLEMRTAQ